MARISLHNRSGDPVTFDLMQPADVNHNLLITGGTRCGKTTMTRLLAASASGQGQFARIATIGNDYRDLTLAHSGLYRECSVFRPLSFNPFSTVVNWDEDRFGVTAVFAAMVSQAVTSNSDLLPTLSVVQSAVTNAWRRYRHEADITSVHEAVTAMEGVSQKAQQAAAAALHPFLPGEIYELWFSGPALDISGYPIVTFNLENLMLVAPLYKAVVPALLHLYGTDMARNADHRRLIILDTLWQLNVPTATMSALLKQGKASGSAIVMEHDSFDDLRHMTVGALVTDNCHHMAFFPCTSMSFNSDVFIEAGIPPEALSLIDSPEGRRRHLFYLTSRADTFCLHLP